MATITATEIINALTEAVTLESQKLAEQLTPVFACTKLMDEIAGNRVMKFGTNFQVKFPLELTLPGTIKYATPSAGALAGDSDTVKVFRPNPANIDAGIALEDMPLGYSTQVTVNLTKYIGSVPVMGHHLVVGDIVRTVTNLTKDVFGRAAELVARADAAAVLAEAPGNTPGVLASVTIAAGETIAISNGADAIKTFTEGASDFAIGTVGNVARLVPNERYWLYNDTDLETAPTTSGDNWNHNTIRVWVQDRKLAKAGERTLTLVFYNGSGNDVTISGNQTLYLTVPDNSKTNQLFPIGLEELATDTGNLFRDSSVSRDTWGAVLSSPVYDPGSTTVPTAAVIDNALRLVESTAGKLTGDWLLISSPGVYLSHVRSEEIREYKLRPAKTIEGGHTGFEYAYPGGVLTWVTEPMLKGNTIYGLRKGAVKKLIPPLADRVQFWAHVFGYNSPYIIAYKESTSGYSTQPVFAATVPFHTYRQFIGWPRDFFRIDNMAEQSY